MRFFYAKNTLKCKDCGSDIHRGEVCIRTYMKNKITGQGFGLVYHYECYITAFTERIRTQALGWLGQQEERKKLGRPTIYKDGKEIHRVKALLYYHRKAGNYCKVQELQSKLSELRT